jgi:membrane associated rhomboid family serine protease
VVLRGRGDLTLLRPCCDPTIRYMPLDQRDYMNASYGQTPPRMVTAMRMASVTTWIIVINVAVFLFDRIFGRPDYITLLFHGQPVAQFSQLAWWGHFSTATAIYHLQLWRFLTFQFLHANFGHLFFNMLALYFFGPMIESYLGPRRYLAFYLLCGMAGAVSYLLLWMFHVLVGYSWVPLIGASAGIFGVLIAAARIAPNTTVLIYGILPMRLKTMAWLLFGIAVYTVFTNGRNAGGEGAHLGGAVLGYILMAMPRLLDLFRFDRARQPQMRYRGW